MAARPDLGRSGCRVPGRPGRRYRSFWRAKLRGWALLPTLAARQRLEVDAVGLVSLAAEPALAVHLVVGVIALEPDHLAVAFERQDMGGDAVEKPAVMGDDHGTACELGQRLLER